MQSIRAYDNLKRLRLAAKKGYLRPVGGLIDRADRIIEDILGRAARGFIQHFGQVSAQNLQFPAGKSIRQLGDHPVLLIHHGDRPGAGFVGFDRIHQPHPIEHAHACTAKIHGVATRPNARRPLYHGYIPAKLPQPKRQRRPRDAGARDQNAIVLHLT